MPAEPLSKRKSCAECVKAKRKCGMELPRCRRCSKKDVVCAYPSRTMVSDMAVPELEFPWLDDLMKNPSLLPWAGELQPQLDAASNGAISGASTYSHITPSHTVDGSSSSPESDVQYVARDVPDYHACNMEERGTLARSEKEAALYRFKTWPEKWVREGKAPFIHPQLYASGMPRPLQDAYAACAIYSTKTEQNEFVAFTVIESKANELLRSPEQHSWTTLDLLAAVQALLILQFIRLFDGDIRQRALAEKAESVLESWTHQLKARTVDEQAHTADTAPSWRSWIFAESIRRTITMSLLLAGTYSLVKLGYCTLGKQVTDNSFNAQRRLWEAQNALEWERTKKAYNSFWIPKMSFDHLMQEGKSDEIDDFGTIMLIMYKGQSVVDDWMATSQANNQLVMDTNLSGNFWSMVQGGGGPGVTPLPYSL